MLRSLVPGLAVLLFARAADAQPYGQYPAPPPPPAAAPPPPYYGPGPGSPPPQAQAPCAPIDEDEPWEYGEGGCKKKKDKPWEQGSVFGVRVGMTTTKGAEKDGTFGSAMVSAMSEQFKTVDFFTLHESSHASIGGGTAGFEGSLGVLFTFGVRAPFGKQHGPFARMGLQLEMMGNSRFYFSQIALPVAEVGYQYIKGRNVFELGGRGAPVISGRYNTGHRTRRELGDGSLEWGGYLAAHTKYGRIDVSYMRFEADDNFPGGPVGVLRGNACVYVGKRIGICADGMYLRGDAYFGLPLFPGQLFERDVRTFYGGLTIGLIDL